VRRRIVTMLIVVLALVVVLTIVGAYYFYPQISGKVSENRSMQLAATRTAKIHLTPSTTYKAVGCGVQKNSNGTFSFSWLHVSPDGQVVDANGCIVPLTGINMGGLFLADAEAPHPNGIAWYKRTFQMNLVRVNFNSYWWDTNVFVPKENMGYRQWLQQYVHWQEQSGNYVELDEGPNFTEPPCGGTITFCPAEDQGEQDYKKNPNPTTALELEQNIAPGEQAWTDLAKLYANDPAVIYDVLNEPTGYPNLYRDSDTLINIIRSQNPRALVVVFANGWKGLISGKYPWHKEPNLVIDAHIYDGFQGTSPATNANCSEPGSTSWSPSSSNFQNLVDIAHSYGQGVIINEWGGCYDDPTYNQRILSFAAQNDVGLAYFQSGNLRKLVNSNQELNGNGLLVQTGYASVFSAETK
jgi:hypothetical protein